jgi:hypothetical protein
VVDLAFSLVVDITIFLAISPVTGCMVTLVTRVTAVEKEGDDPLDWLR